MFRHLRPYEQFFYWNCITLIFVPEYFPCLSYEAIFSHMYLHERGALFQYTLHT
jgi:hypothetical protein